MNSVKIKLSKEYQAIKMNKILERKLINMWSTSLCSENYKMFLKELNFLAMETSKEKETKDFKIWMEKVNLYSYANIIILIHRKS